MMQWPTEHDIHDMHESYEMYHRVPMRNQFLQRHPVLMPVTLLMSSLLLCMASIFVDTTLSWLTLIGIPISIFALFCFLLACVLGIAGALTGITGILERVDRSGSFTKASLLAFFRLKEQTYVNRN